MPSAYLNALQEATREELLREIARHIEEKERLRSLIAELISKNSNGTWNVTFHSGVDVRDIAERAGLATKESS